MKDNLMTLIQRGVLAAVVVLVPGMLNAVDAQENNQPPPGFKAIFDGKTLDGWHGLMPHGGKGPFAMSKEELAAKIKKDTEDMRKHWYVEDGQLVNDGHGAYLTTDAEFGDIEFWIDYNTVAKADSGIYLRGTPQVQIWDFTKAGGKWKIGADKGSGGLYNNGNGVAGRDPLVLADKPFGEWNRFRIRQVGARTSVWLNGKHVVGHATMKNFWAKDKPLYKSGVIQLQTHGGEIRWRNLFVRQIPSNEANEILATEGADGFESVFNGKNLDGWQGAVQNYEVVDGALMCKKGSGGNLFTTDEYANFVVRLEFQLPPAGNNGLAIRYPGDGNPAYKGMTELQVLDTEHKRYSGIDARQAHGSAYGMAAAHRGFLRPTGEWNFQEVTVDGSKIRVELNGYTILDTDLSKITEYMANSPHPGKALKKGFFGFAGHNDPVKFRNIRIKQLP